MCLRGSRLFATIDRTRQTAWVAAVHHRAINTARDRHERLRRRLAQAFEAAGPSNKSNPAPFRHTLRRLLQDGNPLTTCDALGDDPKTVALHYSLGA